MHKELKTPKSVLLVATIASSCILVVILFYDFSSSLTRLRNKFQSREDQGFAHSLSLHKRSVNKGKHFKYYDSCVVATPSKADIQKLCKHQECSTISCVHSCTCGSACRNYSQTSCFSPACSQFSYSYKSNDIKHDRHNVTAEELSRTINQVVNGTKAAVDLEKNIQVVCSDPTSHLLHQRLELDIYEDKSRQCKNDPVTEAPLSDGGTDRSVSSGLNIHIIYFRFLSRWESLFKLPRLNSFIASKISDPNWQVKSFNQVQSQNLGLEDNLLSLLRRPAVPKTNETETDLIKLSVEKGWCFIFDAIACHKSKIYKDITQMMSSEFAETNCKAHQNAFVSLKTSNRTFCSSQGDSDMDMEDALYIHDRLNNVFSTSSRKQLSLSVINIPDLPSTYAFDTAVTDVVSNILRHPSNVLVIMSDVGDPKFSRLDESVFLRTQTFNPLLHVLSPTHANLSHQLLRPDPEINDSNFRLMDISAVFDLTKALISFGNDPGEGSLNFEDVPINNSSQGYQREEDTPSRSCPSQKIKGPVECLCQGKAVYFVSDSVQAAFASFVVGSLNAELQDTGNTRDQDENRKYKYKIRDKGDLLGPSKCDRLVGVSFSNVQHVLWQNSTFILMTLTVQPSFSRFPESIKIEAEIEYVTSDKNKMNLTASILTPNKIKLGEIARSKNSLDRKILHLLCREPNDLNESRASRRTFLDSLSSGTLFGVKGKVKSIHFPCLYTITTTFPDSAILEAANVCTDRTYNLTIGLELFNVISLSGMQVEVKVRPSEVRYITSLVKAFYGLSSFAYKTKTTYTVHEFEREMG